MNENEISQLISQLQTSIKEKLENILREMKNNLELQGKWTPELEERLRKAIKLSNQNTIEP